MGELLRIPGNPDAQLSVTLFRDVQNSKCGALNRLESCVCMHRRPSLQCISKTDQLWRISQVGGRGVDGGERHVIIQHSIIITCRG